MENTENMATVAVEQPEKKEAKKTEKLTYEQIVEKFGRLGKIRNALNSIKLEVNPEDFPDVPEGVTRSKSQHWGNVFNGFLKPSGEKIGSFFRIKEDDLLPVVEKIKALRTIAVKEVKEDKIEDQKSKVSKAGAKILMEALALKPEREASEPRKKSMTIQERFAAIEID